MTDAEFIDAQTLVSRWDHCVVQPELQHSLGIRSGAGYLGPNLCCVSLLSLFFSLSFSWIAVHLNHMDQNTHLRLCL